MTRKPKPKTKPATVKTNDDIEVWKPVRGYEASYEVSNHGSVRKISTKSWMSGQNHRTRVVRGPRTLKVQMNSKYPFVSLNAKSFRVHRLVAQAFVPNDHNKPCVNHIDGNKKNFRFDNLEWVTSKENTRHATETGLMDVLGESNGNSTLSESDVLRIRLYLKYGITCAAISRGYGVNESTIQRVNLRISWKHV